MMNHESTLPAAKPSARAAFLRVAVRRLEAGELNQAIDLFCQVLASYPNTPEAAEAAVRLAAQAQAYEEEGRLRLALELYRKLERLT